MSSSMLHALYTKALREASTELGKQKMENAAVEEVMTETGLM